jgi:hypothetical protein
VIALVIEVDKAILMETDSNFYQEALGIIRLQ